MKLKQIALAIGVTLMATAAVAAPITPAQIGAAQSNLSLQKAWITGASAPTRVIYEGWVDGCDAGTNSIFVSQAASNTAVIPGSIGNFLAYACTRGGIASILFHTVDGGSLNAYAPHTVGTKLARMSLASIIATTSTPLAYSDASQPLNSANVYKGVAQVGSAQLTVGAACTTTAINTSTSTCTTNNVGTTAGTVTPTNYSNQQSATATAVAGDANGPQSPVGGFSDVEAALFPAALGGGDVSSKGAEFQANIGQVFGVAVSTNLYRAMQTAQGITAADTNFDPALAPNITTAQYAAIIDNDGTSPYKADWSALLGTAGVGKKVILARRVPTSGTQAASNAFFLRTPCTDAVSGSLVPATAADSVSGVFEVSENASTGNVKSALTAANTAGNFAIGVMSAENDWSLESATASPLANGYRWLKVDGVHPETTTDFTSPLNGRGNARLSAVTGNYPFHMETRYFVAKTAPAGFGANIVPTIAAKLGNPPTAAACNTVPRGLTLNPAGGSTCAASANVIHKGTSSGNSCAPIKLFF